MNNNMFPIIEKYKYKENVITDEERMIYQYPIVFEYLKKIVNGYGISGYLENRGVHNVCLYAVTEFTNIAIHDIELSNRGVKVCCIGDAKPEKYCYTYEGYDVVNIEKLKKYIESNKIEMIIVCSIFHEYEIIKQLVDNGIHIQYITTLNSYIFD